MARGSLLTALKRSSATPREEAIALGIPGEDFDAIVRPEKMISPG